MIFRPCSRGILSTLALITFLIPLGVSAQNNGEFTPEVTQPDDQKLHITVGGSVNWAPRYSGSDSEKFRVIPIVAISYDRFFLGGGPIAGSPALAAGYKLVKTANLTAGVFVGDDIAKNRKESDFYKLRGTGDIDRTTWVGAFGKYTQDWFSVAAAVRQDVGGESLGLVADFAVDGIMTPTNQFTVTFGPRMRVSNSSRMNTLYGVSTSQSAASGLPQYRAGSGIEHVGLALGMRYNIDRNWFTSFKGELRRLQGDTKDSPVVEDRSQLSLSALVGYTF